MGDEDDDRAERLARFRWTECIGFGAPAPRLVEQVAAAAAPTPVCAFYLSLSRRHLARRMGEPLPPILWPPGGLPADFDGHVFAAAAPPWFDDRYHSQNAIWRRTSKRVEPVEGPRRPCAVCASPSTECVHVHQWAGNTGRGEQSEHRCAECGLFTTYDFDQ